MIESTMNHGDVCQPPAKKRRFFVDDDIATAPPERRIIGHDTLAEQEQRRTVFEQDPSSAVLEPQSGINGDHIEKSSSYHPQTVRGASKKCPPSRARNNISPNTRSPETCSKGTEQDYRVFEQLQPEQGLQPEREQNGHWSSQKASLDDLGHGKQQGPMTATPTRTTADREGRNGECQVEREAASEKNNDTGFDIDLFAGIIGAQVPRDIVEKIRITASNNVERAVNVYFDGSWKAPKKANTNSTIPAPVHQQTKRDVVEEVTTPDSQVAQNVTEQPPLRYIGAFGVGAWATRSGTCLLKYGEHVNIERTRTQPVPKRSRGGSNKEDILTRFTNQWHQEVGRLPRDTAEWVSTLIDQGICQFEGTCVFAPDRIRVNDTIYLQLRCYLLKEAFQPQVLGLSVDDNRSIGIFEEKESTEERKLRLRQVALVKLFDETGLKPTSSNELSSKHKKDGLLRAAEMAEQYDKAKKDKERASKDNNDSEEDESQELEEDQLDTLYKKAQSFDFDTPETEPPSTFVMNLRRYQRQALHWMLAKEMDRKLNRARSMHPLWEEYAWPSKDADDNVLPVVHGLEHFYVNPYSGELSLYFPVQDQRCLGGILADEMGLGKTIEMLSLIHSHRIQPGQQASDGSPDNNDLANNSNSPSVIFAPYTTLIVAPTTLLSQWEDEALKASKAETVKVLMYYGNDKAVSLRHICAANNAGSAPTIVITSYGVVLSEFRSFLLQSSSATSGGLFSVEFFRVILDEAHMIKNRSSKSAKACYELKAAHRWVLTGTPIVNRLEDLFSLVRFLKVEPWNNFSFWKTFITVPFESKDYARALNVVQTVLEPLVLRRTKSMKTPDGEPLVPLPSRTINIEELELSTPEREIYDFIYTRARQTFNSNVEAGTLLKSFTTIFAQILRLRQTCCHPILTRHKAIVSDEEDSAAAENASTELKDDMDLQELIDRFTATTESADAEQKQDSTTKFTTYALRQIQTESSGECPICAEEPMIDPAVTSCWHSACKKCLEDYIRHQTDKGMSPRCFSCRAPISSKDIFEVVRHSSPGSMPQDDQYDNTPASSSQPAPRISLRRINPISPSAHTSAKIHALINHLIRLPPNAKSVVFSQFTSFLDLIGPQLTKAGIAHLRLDGTMPQKARAIVLAQFSKTEESYDEEDIDEEGEGTNREVKASNKKNGATGSSKSPNVLLISLRSGGVGLNLTAASNVFMMDPWWSFAVEAQAIDRVHRMGQLRDVNVTRFVVKDSIEGRMLRIQERKMNIAGSLGLRVGGDGDEDDRKKERVEELKLLFE